MSALRQSTEAIDGTTRVAGTPRTAWTGAVLLITDTAAMTIAMLVAVVLVRAPEAAPDAATWLRLMPVTLLAPLAFAVSGLYPGAGLGPVAEYRRLGRALVAAGGTYLLASSLVWETMALAAPLVGWVALALATVPAGRAVAREFHARQHWWGVPVVILGDGPSVETAIDQLQGNPRLGLRPIAFMVDDVEDRRRHVRGVPVTGTVAEAPVAARNGHRPRLLVLPRSPAAPPEVRIDLDSLADAAFVVPSTLESIGLTGVTPTALDRALQQRRIQVGHRHPQQGVAKRALDLFLALPFGVVALPLIAVAAVAIVIVSPGTPFYAQERTGLGGRTIRVWKLRTMYTDAAARLARHLTEDPAAELEWSRSFKLARDPRILPVVGGFLRASSIDELPQLFNVLRGDMSFVGPRPFPDYHLAAFDEDFRQLRTTVRPGITGLWQVTLRSDGDLDDQRALDTAYILNWSLALDLNLLARTPLAVLSARGAR